MKTPGAKRLANIAFIAVLSLTAVFGMTGAIYPYAFHDQARERSGASSSRSSPSCSSTTSRTTGCIA